MSDARAALAAGELLYADVTLRAEGDGATARAHRGVLAAYSGVFRDALLSLGGTSSADRDIVIPLPGKSAAQLELLLGWMYRREKAEQLTPVRTCDAIDALLHCALPLAHAQQTRPARTYQRSASVTRLRCGRTTSPRRACLLASLTFRA